MTFSDQTLNCRDCNQAFVFTVGEQELYASRGLMHSPIRCPSCSAAHKAQADERSSSYKSDRSGGFREPRQLYTIICSRCGNEAQVPFQPQGDRVVYCSDCYQRKGSDRISDRRSRWHSS